MSAKEYKTQNDVACDPSALNAVPAQVAQGAQQDHMWLLVFKFQQAMENCEPGCACTKVEKRY